MSEQDKRKDKRDDYWDIEKLVPKRRSKLTPFATGTPTSPHTVHGTVIDTAERPSEERKISFDSMRGIAEPESVTYSPGEHGLIKRVTVTRFIDKYDFYDSFRKSALLYFDCPATKCEFVQFFSYMPQYSHLTQAQRAYYLYWRQEARSARYIKSDYSYIYLYVYEILNLPDKIPPTEGIRLLCDIWRAYRKELPRLDANLAVWVQDYCLVHQLPCPIEYISDFMFECINASVLKEFYISDLTKVGIAGVEPLLACLSDYDWRRGKFVGGDAGKTTIIQGHEDYKKQMLGAMYMLLSAIWDTQIVNSDTELFTVKRSSFPNSLCTHMVKSRLSIEYVYLMGNESLRGHITAAVRYTENKLRALLGVKSRLGVNDLPDEYKLILDRYFDVYFKREQRRRQEENRPEYERLYEAPKEEMSFEGADEIERISWHTTARLVDGDDLPPDTDDLISTPAVVEVQDDEPTRESNAMSDDTLSDCYGLSRNELLYLAYTLGLEGGNDALTNEIPAETIAEHINEAFAENFGDVILECGVGGYQVIEDYKEEMIEWLTVRLR